MKTLVLAPGFVKRGLRHAFLRGFREAPLKNTFFHAFLRPLKSCLWQRGSGHAFLRGFRSTPCPRLLRRLPDVATRRPAPVGACGLAERIQMAKVVRADAVLPQVRPHQTGRGAGSRSCASPAGTGGAGSCTPNFLKTKTFAYLKRNFSIWPAVFMCQTK